MSSVFCSKPFSTNLRALMYQVLAERVEKCSEFEDRTPMVLVVCTKLSWESFSRELNCMQPTAVKRRGKSTEFWLPQTMNSFMADRDTVQQALQQVCKLNPSVEILHTLRQWNKPAEIMCLVISDFNPTVFTTQDVSLKILHLVKRVEDVNSALCLILPVKDLELTPEAFLKEGIKCLVMKCDFCNKSECKLRLCAQCFDVSYCSKECQKQHWKDEHKAACKARRSGDVRVVS